MTAADLARPESQPLADVPVEHAVRRIAELVLHAAALAERLQRLPVQGEGATDRESRLGRLQDAVDRGRVALHRIAIEPEPSVSAVQRSPARRAAS